MCRRNWWCGFLVLLVCLLLVPNPCCGLPTAEELPPLSPQEALGLLASLQQAHESSSNELRRLALHEFLAAVQRQELEEREREEGEEYPPMALPFQGQIAASQDKDAYSTEKRGSYISLCHFKICNMGRKRSFPVTSPGNYWNSWPKNSQES